MKLLSILGLFLISISSYSATMTIDVPKADSIEVVCQNTKTLLKKLSPYVDIKLVECDGNLIQTGFMGSKTYSVKIQLDSNVETCRSEENQAIMFDIPTDTYEYWHPPVTFSYINKILKNLEFQTEIIVSKMGSTTVPKYKQLVLIPRCAIK